MEVNYNSGGWGTVCDDSWIISDGDVACRMLGYKSASSVVDRARYGEGSGIIWFDDVYCEGSESSLLDCSHSGFQVHNCRHSEDAGVVCSSKSASWFHYCNNSSCDIEISCRCLLKSSTLKSLA